MEVHRKQQNKEKNWCLNMLERWTTKTVCAAEAHPISVEQNT